MKLYYLVMNYLEEALSYISEAANLALHSNCLRSRCGSVIVSDKIIIGSGWNSPPQHRVLKYCFKDDLPKDFKSDRTCCVHAEQRAIMDALRKNPDRIVGSRLYFIRLDDKGNKLFAGDPYCTICSKMALDVGIKEFVLFHEKGICVYDTFEYNEISFCR